MSVTVPHNRMSSLRKEWLRIYKIIVEQLYLQVKMVSSKRLICVRTCKETKVQSALQKAADFLKAYCLGFAIDDAITLIRMEDVYTEVFEIKDVRTLAGENLSRAIGRIVGKDGKTKFAIENLSKTRVVICGQKIHILGTYTGIGICRDAIVSLIIGATPGKVYAKLRTISSRLRERQ